MYTMQHTDGQKVQVTPLSNTSLGNYGKSDPMQAWGVTFHYDSVAEACVKAEEFSELLAHHKPLTGFNYAFHPV